MRPESDLSGPHASELSLPLNGNANSVRHIGPASLAPCPFVCHLQPALENSAEADDADMSCHCAEELLKRVLMQLQESPCDDLRRAYYHLVKAQDCLKHHRAA